ncbi:hypothetical protein O181_045727 [Austropuccinia psidii MF-1]|uniref:Uncharacterized protein n=1 Tax=Austropuccinia psidii MF-1 TaxID=1389203 RepID=A0A9Q3DUE8_9BASI|nr:hypothetical protein [Austropuccinia psidii MF-1]
MRVMLTNKHTKNACLLCNTSNHTARGVPEQEALVRTPPLSTMMKAFPSGSGCCNTKQADRNICRQLAWCPQFSFSSLTHFSSHNHTEFFSLCLKQNTPNPAQKDSPFPCVPCKQTPWKPTPGLSGTQWLEDLIREPSQYNEPPIPGPSQSSESQLPSHEDTSTCEPEPEVAPMQSMEDPFGKLPFFCLFSIFPHPSFKSSSAHSTTPCSIIILDDTPVGSPPPLSPCFLPLRTQLSPPLIPMVRLNRNSLTCNQP